AATVYTVKKINASAMVSQPLRFIPSGEPKYDSANLDRIRADWHTKNNGMGLRDVR
ncbi:uncharacterized protein B0P05DRAFT_478410, partial [Gilbertella persicaria]|uniref:uncharacterized protein n=1 Tax=Gilbertella persicaria TaxID=101096 RepID=UPI00221F64C6